MEGTDGGHGFDRISTPDRHLKQAVPTRDLIPFREQHAWLRDVFARAAVVDRPWIYSSPIHPASSSTTYLIRYTVILLDTDST